MVKRRKPSYLNVSARGLDVLAGELMESHASLLGEGFVLSKVSRVWRRPDGSWGARFIYKSTTTKGVTLKIEHRVDFVESP